jgi:hypothetical protein
VKPIQVYLEPKPAPYLQNNAGFISSTLSSEIRHLQQHTDHLDHQIKETSSPVANYYASVAAGSAEQHGLICGD